MTAPRPYVEHRRGCFLKKHRPPGEMHCEDPVSVQVSFWDGQGVEIETRYHLEGVECGGFGFRFVEPTAMSLMVSKELLGRPGARA